MKENERKENKEKKIKKWNKERRHKVFKLKQQQEKISKKLLQKYHQKVPYRKYTRSEEDKSKNKRNEKELVEECG